MIDPLHDIDSKHELSAVYKAMKALTNEIYMDPSDLVVIDKYLHYLYGIGFHQGMRTKAPTRPVYQYTLDGEYVTRHDSAVSASLKFGVNRGSVSRAARKGFTCQGFRFSYTKEKPQGSSSPGV